MNLSSQITFVCAIEYGRLEDQTLLMLGTLRANGGRLANARVIAVIPRAGPRLAPETIATLNELSVELVRADEQHPAAWYNFANKLVAIRVVERMATTPLAAWLDSDVLIASAPMGLLLKDEEDLGARGEYLIPALYEGATEQEPYWRALCAIVGLSLEDLPFITMDNPKLRMRRYFNAGIYVWRRGLNFPAAYIDDFKKVMRSRLCLADGNIHMTDQVLLGVVAARLGMRCKHLDYREHHMTFPGQIEGVSASRSMADSELIHYSKSLTEPHRSKFLARLEREVPQLHRAVLEAPARHSARLDQRLGELMFRGPRNLRLRHFQATAKPALRG